jgi:cell division protease FtsH
VRKKKIQEIVFLKNPEKYTNLGGKIPKDLTCRASRNRKNLISNVAGEAQVPFSIRI